MKLIRAGVLFGFLVWAAGTAFLVPLGRFVFGPENRLPVALSATLLVVATFAGVFAFARRILARDGAPVFSHRVLPGSSSRSFGIEVARMAGLPSTVTGPVQPFGLRSTIIGQRGRSRTSPLRAR